MVDLHVSITSYSAVHPTLGILRLAGLMNINIISCARVVAICITVSVCSLNENHKGIHVCSQGYPPAQWPSA